MDATLDCNELVELVTAYLDGSIDPASKARFEAHLRDCDGCEGYLQQFRSTIDTLGHIESSSLDPVFRDRLLAALREK